MAEFRPIIRLVETNFFRVFFDILRFDSPKSVNRKENVFFKMYLGFNCIHRIKVFFGLN